MPTTSGKYSLKGTLRYPEGRAPTCGTQPFSFALRVDDAPVVSETVPFLRETSPGKRWKYKAPRGAAGLKNVSLKQKGIDYELRLKGTGGLSALYGADLAVEVGCGDHTASAVVSFIPKVSPNTLVLKYPR